jgi:transposase
MSLKPHFSQSVPEETARVARAAFPNRNPYLTFQDTLGTVFQDEDFTVLFPSSGQPGLPPWRLGLITIMQFHEQLSDRQAEEAVRARIDWKYLLGLELSDPGSDFSMLSEFRDRLLAGSAEALLLDKLLERCRALVQVLMKKGPKLLDFAVAWRYSSLCFHRPERRILRWHAAANSPMSVSFHPWNAPSSSTGSAPRPSRRTGQAREDHFVLLRADGLPLSEIACRLAMGRRIARTWLRRFINKRLPGLVDKPGRGRPPVFSIRRGRPSGQDGLRATG